MTQETITETNPKQQRLYIGGIEPPRLTVRDVAKRLHNIPEIQVLNIDDGSSNQSHLSRTFLFIDVCLNSKHSKTSSEQRSKSAFDVISSHYHNVKWKGCRLSVEIARPHFLQRLQRERDERLQNQQTCEQKHEKEFSNLNMDQEKKTKIPRQLRIRRKHGEEALKVDTKPMELKDFSHLNYYLQKVRKKEAEAAKKASSNTQKQTKQAPPAKKISKRSLHLKFDEDSNIFGYDNEQIVSKTSSTVSTSDSDDELGSEDESIGSRSNSTTESGNNNPVKPSDKNTTSKSSIYVWSDSDSDSGADLNSESQSMSGSAQLYLNHDDQNSNDEADDLQQAEFVWSDDENDNADNSISFTSIQEPLANNEESSVRTKAEVIEFDLLKKKSHDVGSVSISDEESGMGYSGDKSKDKISDESNIEQLSAVQNNSKTNENFDLSTDVSSNLNILSQLFGDVSTKPNLIKANTKESGTLPSGHNQSAPLKMQRFDPTNMTSIQKFQVVKNSDEKKIEQGTLKSDDQFSNNESSDSDGSRDVNDNSSTENETETSILKKEQNNNEVNNDSNNENKIDENYVYAQSKLENIFQQARQEQQAPTFKISPLIGGNLGEKTILSRTNATEDVDDIGNRKKDNVPDKVGNQGGFSFSFQFGDAPGDSSPFTESEQKKAKY